MSSIIIIHSLHILFILFMGLTPFLNTVFLLKTHFIMSPFLMLHWIFNNDVCFFSLLESYITGKIVKETFIGRLVSPIYNIRSIHIWGITLVLFLITGYKLWIYN